MKTINLSALIQEIDDLRNTPETAAKVQREIDDGTYKHIFFDGVRLPMMDVYMRKYGLTNGQSVDRDTALRIFEDMKGVLLVGRVLQEIEKAVALDEAEQSTKH